VCGHFVQVLTLGGSFSGDPTQDKTAELYSGSSWVVKSGIQAASIKSDDAQGFFRQDNYPWLFAWTGNTGMFLVARL
jgi:hypothetical protein